ncbi:MAG TPA: hypothetical protein VMR62_09200 [Bryobacteraceae bacterium]|nr:hypothetical protein [Bryobacteraceae bacterium]
MTVLAIRACKKPVLQAFQEVPFARPKRILFGQARIHLIPVRGGLVLDTNGNYYGTTYGGGPGEDGSVFTPVGLGACVETGPTSGKVGTAVEIPGKWK